jgi:hypothetical protein
VSLPAEKSAFVWFLSPMAYYDRLCLTCQQIRRCVGLKRICRGLLRWHGRIAIVRCFLLFSERFFNELKLAFLPYKLATTFIFKFSALIAVLVSRFLDLRLIDFQIYWQIAWKPVCSVLPNYGSTISFYCSIPALGSQKFSLIFRIRENCSF